MLSAGVAVPSGTSDNLKSLIFMLILSYFKGVVQE